MGQVDETQITYGIDCVQCRSCGMSVSMFSNPAFVEEFAFQHREHDGYVLIGRIIAPPEFVSGQQIELEFKAKGEGV
jgi:hypothetical protein